MANDLNLCVFIGRLGADVEGRETPSGTEVANFSIATNSKYKDNETTTWINLVAWDNLARICSEYLSKGDQIQVTARYQNRKYEDKDGNNKYVHEFVVQSMQMLGSGRGSVDDHNPPDEHGEIPF